MHPPHPQPQVDLAMEPQRRDAMLAGSDGLKALPQLHVNGRYIGSAEDLQARAWAELGDPGMHPLAWYLAERTLPACQAAL